MRAGDEVSIKGSFQVPSWAVCYHAHLWVFKSIAGGKISSDAVSQQDELFETHFDPPLVEGLDKEVLRLLPTLGAELGATGQAGSQPVQG